MRRWWLQNMPSRNATVPMDLWLVLGDSEAAQGGVLATNLPSFYPPIDGSMFMVDQTTLLDVVPLEEPSGVETNTFGIGGIFSWYRARQTERRTCVANCAVSGTNSTYYQYSAVPLSGYQRALISVQTALAVPGCSLAGFLIYGGANDGSLASPDWDGNWTTALADLRAGIGAEAASTPVVYVQLPPGPPVAPYSTSWATVITQQASWESLSVPLRTMVEAIQAGPWGDIQYVHLNGYGIEDLATKVATDVYGAIPVIPVVALPTDGLDCWAASDAEVTQSGGLVTAVGNQVGTDNFTAAGALRPTLLSAAWNGQDVLDFDGAANVLTSSRAASGWNYVTDGSGCTINLVFDDTVGDADLMSTYLGSGAGGLLLRHSGGRVSVWVDNGTGFANSYVQGAEFYVDVGNNLRTFLQLRMQTGNYQMRINGRPWQVPAAYHGSEPAACSYSLKVGGAFYYLNGGLPEWLIYNRFLTDEECNAVANRYMQKFACDDNGP